MDNPVPKEVLKQLIYSYFDPGNIDDSVLKIIKQLSEKLNYEDAESELRNIIKTLTENLLLHIGIGNEQENEIKPILDDFLRIAFKENKGPSTDTSKHQLKESRRILLDKIDLLYQDLEKFKEGLEFNLDNFEYLYKRGYNQTIVSLVEGEIEEENSFLKRKKKSIVSLIRNFHTAYDKYDINDSFTKLYDIILPALEKRNLQFNVSFSLDKDEDSQITKTMDEVLKSFYSKGGENPLKVIQILGVILQLIYFESQQMKFDRDQVYEISSNFLDGMDIKNELYTLLNNGPDNIIIDDYWKERLYSINIPIK